MKQILDKNGNIISGLFRNDDGSIVANDITTYKKNKLQHDKFTSLTNEVNLLKEQMKNILEKLNG